MPLSQNHLQSVGQGSPLKFGELRRGGCARLRHLRAIHLGSDRRVLGERMHLKDVHAVGEPLLSGRSQVLGGGIGHALEGGLVEVGAAPVDLVHCEHIGLSTESTDPLDAADEPGPELGLDPLELCLRRPFSQEPGQLFVECALHVVQVHAGPGCALDSQLPTDFPQAHEGSDVGGNLLIVHETLVKARCLARSQYVSDQVQIPRLLRRPLRDVPNLVDPGLRYPILHDLAVGTGPLRDPHVVLCHRRP